MINPFNHKYTCRCEHCHYSAKRKPNAFKFLQAQKAIAEHSATVQASERVSFPVTRINQREPVPAAVSEHYSWCNCASCSGIPF